MSENSGRTRHPKPRDAKTSGSADTCHSQNKTGKTNTTGRPTDYRDEHCREVRKLLLLKKEATDDDIAFYLGVSRSTLSLWKVKHPEFSDAIKRSRKRACGELIDKLFQRATGYSHPAVKFFNTEAGIIQQEYTEHYPPDTAAATFLLKNWCGDEYRDKQIHEHAGEGGGPIQLDTNAAELRKLAEKRGLVPALTPLKPAGT